MKESPTMGRWTPLTDDEASRLERELTRELASPAHALRGLRVKAISRRDDCDDVAYVLDDGRRCIVHLTWNVESDSSLPACDFVSVLEDD
jgi:hypothetical protein